MSETLTSLPLPVYSSLQTEVVLLLHTIDFETKSPTVNAVSWIYAKEPTKIRFSVDARSRILTNIVHNPLVSFSYIGNQNVFAISGKAQVLTDELAGVPFKLVCIDVWIDAVREAMFYGARITNQIEFEKTYDKRAAEKLDHQVFDAMKKLG